MGRSGLCTDPAIKPIMLCESSCLIPPVPNLMELGDSASRVIDLFIYLVFKSPAMTWEGTPDWAPPSGPEPHGRAENSPGDSSQVLVSRLHAKGAHWGARGSSRVVGAVPYLSEACLRDIKPS